MKIVKFLIAMLITGAYSTGVLADNEDLNAHRVSVDRVIVTTGDIDKRFLNDYHYAVVQLALEHSRDQFGAYSIEYYNANINNSRVLREMENEADSRRINVHITTFSRLRQERLFTIHVPVRMGLLGYRLLIVHKRDLEKFKDIRTLEALRQFRIGSGARWSITQVFEQHQLNVVPFPRYTQMYSMLQRGRFDFLSRGVSEIYVEWDACTEHCEDFVIVPGVQMYVPMPYYIFVSKFSPRIAKRLEIGIKAAAENGSLKALFLKYHKAYIDRAGLAERRIIPIPNPELEGNPAMAFPHYWFNPRSSPLTAE